MLIIIVPYFRLFCYLIQNIYCLQHFPLSHQSTFALKLIFTKCYTGASYPRDSSKFQTDAGYPRNSSKFYLGASHQRDSSKLYLRAGYSRNFNSAAVPCRNHQKSARVRSRVLRFRRGPARLLAASRFNSPVGQK